MLIRKAVLEDSPAIADCLLLAMEDIVFEFIGKRDKQQAKAFMDYFVRADENQYSFRNCWVAEENGRIAAAVAVYDGADLHRLRLPVARYVESRFGRGFNPGDETGAGEFYIDSLGVDPGQQGKGIGAKLLGFLVEEYVDRRGLTLGLLVDKDNPGAKRLYLKLGFAVEGEKRLAGKEMEHLQIRPGGS